MKDLNSQNEKEKAKPQQQAENSRANKILNFIDNPFSALIFTTVISIMQIGGVVNLATAIFLLVLLSVIITIRVSVKQWLSSKDSQIVFVVILLSVSLLGLIIWILTFWMSGLVNSKVEINQPIKTSDTKFPIKNTDDQLARIEFGSDANKKIRQFYFEIELNQAYSQDELSDFRVYFVFSDSGTVFKLGCQQKINDKGDWQLLVYSTVRKNLKTSLFEPFEIAQSSLPVNTIDCIDVFSIDKLPYQNINALDGNSINIYASESFVEKIKSISLIANNYKIISHNADDFEVIFKNPTDKWFNSSSKFEKAIQWQEIGIKPKTEDMKLRLEAIREARQELPSYSGEKEWVLNWSIDFVENMPIKLPKDSK